MSTESRVFIFDVNETLTDLSPLADAFSDLGVPADYSAIWFSSLLRDAFALTASGGTASFLELAGEGARVLLHGNELTRSLDDSVSAVLHALGTVSLHSDVAHGMQALHAAGHRLFTLSNGPTSTADRVFTAAGIRGLFEKLLSVEEHTAWKPAPASYERLAVDCGVPLSEITLVAVHPWDIHGAARAGLSTAWVNRQRNVYPSYFAVPDLTVTSLAELVTAR